MPLAYGEREEPGVPVDPWYWWALYERVVCSCHGSLVVS